MPWYKVFGHCGKGHQTLIEEYVYKPMELDVEDREDLFNEILNGRSGQGSVTLIKKLPFQEKRLQAIRATLNITYYTQLLQELAKMQ